MRFMYASSGFAQDDNESETPFENNVGGDPAVSPSTDPGGTAQAFKAKWIEVTNHSSEPLLANPYGTMLTGRVAVTIGEGETYRFEWGSHNAQARDKAGWSSIFLLSSATGTTVTITAGAE